MDSPKYIDGVKADLNNKILQYEKDCNDIDKKIRTFINKVDDLNKKKVLPSAVKGIADAVPIYGAGWTGLVIKALAFGASEYDEHRERSSKHKKEKALEMRDEFWSACVNMSPLEESTQLLGDYKMSRNSSTEIICSDENAYIKYGELIEEEW